MEKEKYGVLGLRMQMFVTINGFGKDEGDDICDYFLKMSGINYAVNNFNTDPIINQLFTRDNCYIRGYGVNYAIALFKFTEE